MSDTDQLSAELRELRDQSAEVTVPAPPPLAAITAIGLRRRRRRRLALTGLSVVGATAAAALALGLIAVSGPASTTASSRTPAPGSAAPARIQTAAFTLISNSDGTVTLIIDPLELFEPAALQGDLEQFGIPALVTSGKICTSDPAPAGISDVETYDPGTPEGGATITIDPSAMPAGSKLSFGTVELQGGVQASFSSLIDPDAYTCTSTPPNDAEPHPDREGFIRLTPSN